MLTRTPEASSHTKATCERRVGAHSEKTETMTPISKIADPKFEHIYERDVIIHRAVLKALHDRRSKFRPAWSIVRDLFCVGSTMARDICVAYNIDPDRTALGQCAFCEDDNQANCNHELNPPIPIESQPVMNATELYLKSGQSAGVFFCEKCRNVSRTEAEAEQCCKDYPCQSCGETTGDRLWTVCQKCRREKRQRDEIDRFNKAEKLERWDGWVYDGANYHESIDDYIEDVLDNGGDIHDYVWTCKPIYFVRAEIGDIIDRIGDDAYEDWDPDTLDGLVELEAALDKFNAANEKVCSYSPDFSKAALTKRYVKY